MIHISSNYLLGQGVFLELGISVGANKPEVFKIYCEVESKNWGVQEIILRTTPLDSIKSYRFQFDSKIRNIRFLWAHQNTVFFKDFYLKQGDKMISWTPTEILSYFNLGHYIKSKEIQNETLILESRPPNPQVNGWPIMILEQWGNFKIYNRLYGETYEKNYVSITIKNHNPIRLEVFTINNFIRGMEGHSKSGGLYIPPSDGFVTHTAELLTENDFDHFFILINSDLGSDEISIKEIVYDGEFIRKWDFINFTKYFDIFNYDNLGLENESYVFPFKKQLSFYLKSILISKAEETLNKIVLIIKFLLLILLFFIIKNVLMAGVMYNKFLKIIGFEALQHKS